MGYKSRSTINKIELGINELTQSKIVAFAKLFGVNPCDLLTDESSLPKTEAEVCTEVFVIEQVQKQWGKGAVQLLSAFVELNEQGKKKAIQQLQDLLDVPKYRKEDEE